MWSAAVWMMDFELVLNRGFESNNNKEKNGWLFLHLPQHKMSTLQDNIQFGSWLDSMPKKLYASVAKK